MKKLLSILALMLITVVSADALTLKEAFKEMESLPDLKGVKSDYFGSHEDGWLGFIPIKDGVATYKLHEVGNGQTVYYGSKVDELARELPEDKMILACADLQNLFYVYASPIDENNSEILILIDQAYQGSTMAVLAKVDNHIVKALKAGEVKFTSDHQIVVNVPIMTCNI